MYTRLTRDLEIDPALYDPPDVKREPLTKLPDPLTMPIRKIMKMFGYDV